MRRPERHRSKGALLDELATAILEARSGGRQTNDGDQLIPRRVGARASLRHLIWLRVSQINGCAYCVDLHTHEALHDGESLQRLNCLVTWAETPLFSDRERSALAWAEALTKVSETHAPDEVYEKVRAHFEDKELVDLTLMIASMNAWNRMAIGFRRQPAQREQ